MINKTVCITEYNNQIISWLDVNSKMELLSVTDNEKDIVSNIYVGKIKHVVKNIQACFVEFMPDTLGFLSFNDILPEIKIYEGNDIIVQVVKEASKNKEAVLTTKLSISGDYSVVELGEGTISVSRKISGDIRSSLKTIVEGLTNYNVIVRTNASFLDDYDVLKDEILHLSDSLDNIVAKGTTRESKTLIYKSSSEYLNFIKGLPKDSYERILTDKPLIAEELCSYNCELYKDDYPLSKLYSLETKLQEVLSRYIWLKSGANIVIDTTEAMTVIDVNSGKNLSNKDRETNVLALNKEATVEICRQMRLRNISGIIIVDYINMSSAENQQELMDYLKDNLKKDTVRSDFVDITKLGLIEIVRKKIKPPINELLHK